MNLLWALLIAAFAYAVHFYRSGLSLSPDGQYYLRAALGRPVPAPYQRRWLLPTLLGPRPVLWQLASALSLLALGPLTYAFTGSLGATWLLVWLPGLYALNVRLPALVDAPALAFALGAALAWQRGHVGLAVALALAGGATKESSPIFAAVFAGAPDLLVGLVAVNWWGRQAAPIEPWLLRPWSSARSCRDVLDAQRMLLPWGPLAVVAPLGAGADASTLRAGLALGLGYAQCLVAVDDSRLYQWAAPALLVLAARVESPWIWVACVVAPFAGALHKGS